MSDEVHDTSRVDNFLAARNRAMLWHAAWRPMLAGAVSASLIIAAVWVATPHFTVRDVDVPRIIYRDAEVPHIVTRDVAINNLVPHDVPIEIPRIVVATPAPTTPEERSFVATPGWKGAVVRGRILGPDGNGFVMQTDDGEKSFYPAKVGADGKIKPNPTMKDVVTASIGALAYCRQTPTNAYACTALGRDGQEVEIPQVPIGEPL
jgi:hypothetical protein